MTSTNSEVMILKYATRVNSFLRENSDLVNALAEIGSIDSLDYVDLNYPEHFSLYSVAEVGGLLEKNNLKLSAINIRFRDEFLHGVFTHPDADVRKKAVDLCIEAGNAAKELNGTQMILWLSYDGYDYPFQMDYCIAWKRIRECVQAVCKAVDIPVSIEYKPYEERSNTFMDSYASTLLMVQQCGCPNLGVTIDVCHMLMKKESPAMAAALLLQDKKLFTVHLNDSEGSFDDGLMIGAIHPFKILELFYYLKKNSYDGIIYFDTFPKRESAVRETTTNLAMCKKMESLINTIGLEKLNKIIQDQDAILAMEMMNSCFID